MDKKSQITFKKLGRFIDLRFKIYKFLDRLKIDPLSIARDTNTTKIKRHFCQQNDINQKSF